MRLDVAHELGLALAGTCALLMALLGGELSVLAWLLLFAPWVSMLLRLKGRSAPALSGTVLALASVGLGLATVAQRGLEAAVLAGGYALSGILAARAITRTQLSHDLQLIVLSLLLVIAGSVLNVNLSYGAWFLLYAVAAVWALTTRQLLAGAERAAGGQERRIQGIRARRDVVTPVFLGVTAAVALAVLSATALVFVAFPRMGFGNLGLVSKKQGRFPTAVSLRGPPRAASGGTEVVARVRGASREAFARGLYLRGAVYEGIGEHGFSQIEPPPRVSPDLLRLAPAPEEAMYEVALTPIAGRLLFTLGPTLGAGGISGGYANPNFVVWVSPQSPRGELLASMPLDSTFRYRVNGGIASAGYLPLRRDEALLLDPERHAAFFEVPADLDPRIRALADGVVAGAEHPSEKAARLRRFLLSQFSYTLEQPNGEKEAPLTAFLLEDRRGHCEYFATAYALLLRTQGIASRVIGGYQGGVWDPESEVVIFMGNNAHAWVEWFLPGVGWIVDDPTPAATALRPELAGLMGLLERIRRFWDDSIVDYSLSDQRTLFVRLQRTVADALERVPFAALVGALAGIGGGVLLLLVWQKRRRRAQRERREADALLGALLGALERFTGRPLDTSQTLREAVARLETERALSREHQRVLQTSLQAYEEERFGGQTLPPERRAELLALLAALVPDASAAPVEASAPSSPSL